MRECLQPYMTRKFLRELFEITDSEAMGAQFRKALTIAFFLCILFLYLLITARRAMPNGVERTTKEGNNPSWMQHC